MTDPGAQGRVPTVEDAIKHGGARAENKVCLSGRHSGHGFVSQTPQGSPRKMPPKVAPRDSVHGASLETSAFTSFGVKVRI